MSSPHIAFSKVRAKIRRLHVEVEEAEHEGGELNLVPYLDIVTNTVIFMLATVAAAVGIANINVNAPRYSDPTTAGAANDTPQEKRLNLTVTVSYEGFIVAAAAGVAPTIQCKAALENKRCPAKIVMRKNPRNGRMQPAWIDKYDYKKLVEGVTELKKKFPKEKQVIVMADRTIPYQVVIKTMDHLRGVPTKNCTGQETPNPCLFPQVVLSAGIQ